MNTRKLQKLLSPNQVFYDLPKRNKVEPANMSVPNTTKEWSITGTSGFDDLKFESSAPVPAVGDKDVLVKSMLRRLVMFLLLQHHIFSGKFSLSTCNHLHFNHPFTETNRTSKQSKASPSTIGI